MIEDGQITYRSPEKWLSFWELDSAILHAFLIASFSTILSYQLAAAIIDLCLGIKPAGKAKIRDIASLILAQELSPLAVARSLLTPPNAAKLYTTKEKPSEFDEISRQGTRKISVVAKFLMIIFIAPVVNFIVVAITVERRREMTFAEVDFGGMALGMNDDLRVVPFSTQLLTCWEYAPKIRKREQYVARFFHCSDLLSTAISKQNASDAERDMVSVEIRRDGTGSVTVSLISSTLMWTLKTTINIRTEGRVYRLHDTVTADQGEVLMERAEKQLRLLADAKCKAGEGLRKLEGNPAQSEEDSFVLRTTFATCSADIFSLGEYLPELFLGPVAEPLTIVNAATFKVAREDSLRKKRVSRHQFYAGDGLKVISRKRSVLSGAVVGILAALAIVVRVLVKTFTNNDLDLGVELLLKEQLDLSRYDSMLQNDSKVSYVPERDGVIS